MSCPDDVTPGGPEPAPAVVVAEEPAAGVCLLVVSDDLDMLTTPALRDAAVAALRGAPELLAIDLSRVGFISSTALATLVVVHEQAKAAGGRVCLVAPSRVVRRAIDLLGLATLLARFDSLASAVAALGPRHPDGPR